MDAERWRRVDEILDSALELPEPGRAAYLDSVCGADAELRREVDSLLAADAEADAFLAEPVGRVHEDTAPDPRMARDARLFPSYTLERLLGRSATASVYLAARGDHLDGQLVALKLLDGVTEPGARQNAEDVEADLRQRFVREQQILAHLRHPNIARLFDAGQAEDGRPYLVLEYVEGLPLDVYCRRHRLDVRRRIELFRQVLAAVQYAHQNLLVHRDLKPGNILVTPEGVPKLLDFGIAKSLHPERFADSHTTRLGQRPMTPRYASPEQVRGQPISISSDIYSLGVVLYELLTEKPCYPLGEVAFYELERAICENVPPPPSRQTEGAVSRALEGDLDNILAKALAKSAAERYATVERLSDDLGRHLDDLPVSARPATLGYRLRKLAQRHRAAVVTTLAVVLLVAIFLVALVIQNSRIDRQRRYAESLRAIAEAERAEAEHAASFLIDLFRLANPIQTRGRELTAREILDAGAARIEAELEGQPGLQASLLLSMGRVYSDLGVYDRAAKLTERGIERQRAVGGDLDREVASGLSQLALLHAFRGRYADSERTARESLELWLEITASGDPLPTDAVDIGTVRNHLASTLRNLERPEEAEQVLRAALEGLGPHPARSQSLALLGAVLGDLGRFTEAERAIDEAIEITAKVLGPQNPLVDRHRLRLADLHLARGDAEKSLEVTRLALANLAAALEANHPLIGDSHWTIGRALEALGQAETALAHFDQALDIRRQRLGESHPTVAENAAHLEALSRRLGVAPESVASLAALEVDAPPGTDPALFNPLTNRNDLATEIDQLWRRLEAARSASPHDDARLAELEADLGLGLVRMGRVDEAREHLLAALAAENVCGAPDSTAEIVDPLLDLVTGCAR